MGDNQTSYLEGFTMKIVIALLPAFLVVPVCTAQETFKCKINGGYVYQDRPCPGTGRYSDGLTEKPARQVSTAPVLENTTSANVGQTAPKVQSDLERQKEFLAKGAKDRKVSDLKYQIDIVTQKIANLHSQMNVELANVEHERSTATNNLAGATYLQSLATEKQAISARYELEIGTQRENLKALREELAKVQGS